MANELAPDQRAEKIVRQGGIYPTEKAVVKSNIINEIYAAELAAGEKVKEACAKVCVDVVRGLSVAEILNDPGGDERDECSHFETSALCSKVERDQARVKCAKVRRALAKLSLAISSLAQQGENRQTYFELSPIKDPECGHRWLVLNESQREAIQILKEVEFGS